MKVNEILNTYNISYATLKNWKKLNYINNLEDIDSAVIDKIIKNKIDIRRNKKNSTNYIIPTSYIDDKRIIPIIEKILNLKNKYEVDNNQVLIEVISKILKNNKLDIPKELYKILGKATKNKDFINEFKNIKIEYNKDNDFLGCLYMSLLSIGEKDIKGIFYTPFNVVNQIIQSITFKGAKNIVDPGCGSGNFLIQAYKKMKKEKMTSEEIINNLHGFDIDKIAVLLSKINIYILDSEIKFDEIKICVKDFLNDDIDYKFDIIIGNPPWGKKYTKEEKLKLKEKHGLTFSKFDSFSQFIIRSFEFLNENGTLGFVLPSSILNIAVHEEIRKFLLNYKIEYIKKIGRKFEEIVTDVIIIKVIKNTETDNHICLYDKKEVNQSEFNQNIYCNFLVSDNISKNIINKIKQYKCFHLVENVEYALGVVTGNNKDYISDKKSRKNEPIISGKQIDRYNFDYSKISKYIIFEKEKLQQVAKEDLYRYKNKIIYKFIGKKLCFAVESKGILTLNNANIICLGSEYDLYYISAILNSRITQLYFKDMYDTHKVLKNHIQSFYIPDFHSSVKNEISNISKNARPSSDYCEEIENIIYRELEFSDNEIEYIKNRF